MNNRGFTLIELIATIALLAVISIISFVSVNGILNQSKVNDCKTLVDNIKTATKEYVSDNRYSNIFNNIYDTITIDASNLVNGNYISSPIINPMDKNEIIPSNISISIRLYDDYTVKTVDVVGIDCST